MNEKELNNDLQEVKFEDIKTEEAKAKTTEKKKKEQSNGKKMFKLLLGTVVLIMTFILYQGTWNPFKSTEVSKEAEKAYEESEEVAADIFEKTDEIENKLYNYGPNEDIHPALKPDGQYPYGFETIDYGKAGNKDGVQKYMRSVTAGMREGYGIDLFIEYMVNEDYAKEYYAKLKGSHLGSVVSEYDFKGGKIGFGQTDGNDGALLVIRHGTIVYSGVFATNERYEKGKNLPELLGHDFKFPNKSELFTK